MRKHQTILGCKICECRIVVITLVFQTGDLGSIPGIRSTWGYMFQGFGESDLQSDCGGFDFH